MQWGGRRLIVEGFSAGANGVSIAVLLPCHDEEAAIAQTIASFRAALPTADIYVYDNNSNDNTAAIAQATGAIVRTERIQGKGAVVRRMFADIQADVYVLADGDATYDAAAAPLLISRLLRERLDMVVGTRITEEQAAYRRGHRIGNATLTAILARLFGRSFTDVLSGYRVFSNRFVKSFPILGSGFEIETEINVHALELKMPVGEIETRYFARLDGSSSKLRTYRDGWVVLSTIMTLYRVEKPKRFYGMISAVIAFAALILLCPLIATYLNAHSMPRFPTAILVAGMMILSALSLFAGLILDAVAQGRREVRRLAYLSVPGPSAPFVLGPAIVSKSQAIAC